MIDKIEVSKKLLQDIIDYLDVNQGHNDEQTAEFDRFVYAVEIDTELKANKSPTQVKEIK